jgi:Rrf2 family transcriptional regulator, iron-sulfur cluster assembly transcription factor
MLFSKSFGYALRGILYVAAVSDVKKRVHVDEIATRISVPKHFLGKVMHKIVKKGILDSTKGPFGGLSITNKTMNTTLLVLIKITDGLHPFDSCVLKAKKCDAAKPCPLHDKMARHRDDMYKVFAGTTIGDLKNERSKAAFFKSITT